MGIILGTLSADNIKGTEGLDVITGLSGDDTIFGMGGIDTIDGGLDNDTLYANSKTTWDDGVLDTVLGGAGDDHIYGAYGDVLNGGTGFDLLSLDLSGADDGIQINFKPMTLAKVPDLLTIKIDTLELSGFQAVTDVRGSAFDDRITVGNSDHIGTNVDGGAGDDSVRATIGNDTLVGGDGDDTLYGLRGKDVVSGGDGADHLLGGRSQDILTGGAGADRFVFKDGDSPNSRAHADTITDFSHTDGDKISLRAIDAIEGGDNDRFSFIGDHRFTGTAGELRSVIVDGATFVTGDTDGDGHADFTLRLDGQIDLVKTDFVL